MQNLEENGDENISNANLRTCFYKFHTCTKSRLANKSSWLFFFLVLTQKHTNNLRGNQCFLDRIIKIKTTRANGSTSYVFLVREFSIMGSETWYIFYANLRDSSVVISSLFQKKKLLSRTFLQSNLLSTTIRDLIKSKFHFFPSINGRVIFYQLWKHTVKFYCLLLRDILDFWIL